MLNLSTLAPKDNCKLHEISRQSHPWLLLCDDLANKAVFDIKECNSKFWYGTGLCREEGWHPPWYTGAIFRISVFCLLLGVIWCLYLCCVVFFVFFNIYFLMLKLFTNFAKKMWPLRIKTSVSACLLDIYGVCRTRGPVLLCPLLYDELGSVYNTNIR